MNIENALLLLNDLVEHEISSSGSSLDADELGQMILCFTHLKSEKDDILDKLKAFLNNEEIYQYVTDFGYNLDGNRLYNDFVKSLENKE